MKKFFVVLLIAFAHLLPTSANAQNESLSCEVAWVRATTDSVEVQNVQALDARVCVGDFSSVEEALNPIHVRVNCLDQSGLVHLIGDSCRKIQRETINPNVDNIGPKDSNGDGVDDSYFTCIDIAEINRDVGKISVEFTTLSRGSCTTEPVDTLPENYDFYYEHLRRTIEDTSGFNSGENINSVICADGGINTALGCISYDIVGFTTYILVWSIGVGGGVALVLIAYGGILFMFSQGNPDRVKEAKSVMVAAISGLLLIIFSTFLLRVIGINILELF